MNAISAWLRVQGRMLEVPLCALELSHIGPLAAWSVGGDNALVRTDLTTCQTHSSTNPARVTSYE
jgi:hypothetical protein